MYLLITLSVVIAAAVGLLLKFILQKASSIYDITWIEFAIVMAILTIILAPATATLGWHFAKLNKVAYNEFWNGWETNAYTVVTECERDGSCVHEYDCDPYTDIETYTCNCDDKGNCQTCTRLVTRYHSCPYVDRETTYGIQTNLGSFTIANHRFPENPQSHRWRKEESIPGYVIQNAGAGVPKFWQAAKDRLDSGKPGPATIRKSYKNFIYASEGTILKRYSQDIEKFASKKLFPRFQSKIYDFYYSNKVYFVGYHPNDYREWQKRMAYLNAAFGTELQGDLHLIVVQNELISQNPDSFALALKAYWQDTMAFKADAFSKNSLAIIIGTDDGKTIAWARAFTGMPLGNERLCQSVMNDLKGIEVCPEMIIDNIHKRFNHQRIYENNGKGVIESAIFGVSDPETKFRRVSMSAEHAGDFGSGFLYLFNEIQPSKGQKWFIISIILFFSAIGWVIAVCTGRSYRTGRFYR